MASKKIFKRKAGRRYNKAKRLGKKMMINKALAPFAQRYITRMKYCDSFTLSPITGLYRFSLNSIFKPNITGTGHQPGGTDTLDTIYNRYRVIKCFWRIESFPDADSSANTAYQLVAVPANEPVNPLNAVDAREDPRAKYIVQTSGGPVRVLKGSVSIPSLVGRTKSQYMADDRYQALFSSNPSEAAVLNIFVNNLLGTVTPTVQCQITMTYVVEAFDVKILGRSNL